MAAKLGTQFPAITGQPVTEAHARVCRERGHATHTVDGVESPLCPRCGEERNPKPATRAKYAPNTRVIFHDQVEGPMTALILDVYPEEYRIKITEGTYKGTYFHASPYELSDAPAVKPRAPRPSKRYSGHAKPNAVVGEPERHRCEHCSWDAVAYYHGAPVAYAIRSEDEYGELECYVIMNAEMEEIDRVSPAASKSMEARQFGPSVRTESAARRYLRSQGRPAVHPY